MEESNPPVWIRECNHNWKLSTPLERKKKNRSKCRASVPVEGGHEMHTVESHLGISSSFSSSSVVILNAVFLGGCRLSNAMNTMYASVTVTLTDVIYTIWCI